MGHIQLKGEVDVEQWQTLRTKIECLRTLIARAYRIASPAIQDIIETHGSGWMVFGQQTRVGSIAYGQVPAFAELKDQEDFFDDPNNLLKNSVSLENYHLTEEDYLRGKMLVQRIFSLSEPGSGVRRLIACSEPYSPSPTQFSLLP